LSENLSVALDQKFGEAKITPPEAGPRCRRLRTGSKRLDRLGPAKEVAQIGAAIGREFTHALLAAAVRKPEAELNSALDRCARR
jgi:hypothetical protein